MQRAERTVASAGARLLQGTQTGQLMRYKKGEVTKGGGSVCRLEFLEATEGFQAEYNVIGHLH